MLVIPNRAITAPNKPTSPDADTKIQMRRLNHMSLSRVAANGAPRHPNAAAALGTPPRRARRRQP